MPEEEEELFRKTAPVPFLPPPFPSLVFLGPRRTSPPFIPFLFMTRPENETPANGDPSPYMEARRAFPAGLEQPAGSFRFSVDALLLAAFAANRTENVTDRFIDLGTGCGIVGLAYLLLKRNNSQGIGIDCTFELIKAARKNAARLGFSDQFIPCAGELADTRFLEKLRTETSPVRLIMANPPWRLIGSGRLPATEARRKALFGDKDTFPLFASAASFLLDEGGRFACIISPDRLHDMLAALCETGLSPYLLQFIHKQKNTPATFVLIEARKGTHAETHVAEPVALYASGGFFTLESLAFCPFLR